MKAIISNLFIESGFTKEEKRSEIHLFRRPDGEIREFYFAHFITENDIPNYLSHGIKVLEAIFEAVQMESEEVSKNSSLLLCVEYLDHVPEKVEERKRTIEIEEHQYDIRKYVINYTPASIAKLEKESSLKGKILEISQNEERFEKFARSAIVDMEYYVAMQLLTKLPFLTLNAGTNSSLESLETFLIRSFGTEEELHDAEIALTNLEGFGLFSTAGSIEKLTNDQLMAAILLESEDVLLKSILEV